MYSALTYKASHRPIELLVDRCSKQLSGLHRIESEALSYGASKFTRIVCWGTRDGETPRQAYDWPKRLWHFSRRGTKYR